MFLGEIAESHYDQRGQDFGNGGENMKLLHKEFDENIIEQDTNEYHQKVAEQLHPPPKTGAGENHIMHEQKARREADTKSQDESHDIGTHGQGTPVYNLFMQQIMIADVEEHNVQQGIGTTTGRIAKSLQRHELPERGIKKINKGDDQLAQYNFNKTRQRYSIEMEGFVLPR